MDTYFLFTKGATVKNYDKNQIIFEMGSAAHFCYQVVEGHIKLFVCNENGKEFILEYFSPGDIFGIAPLLSDEAYTYSAATVGKTALLRLPKNKFMQTLEESKDFEKDLLGILSHRLNERYTACKCIINQSPEFRIVSLLNSYKKRQVRQGKEMIPFTRQEIADCTGLRVETVCRVVSKLQKENKLELVNHKIYY